MVPDPLPSARAVPQHAAQRVGPASFLAPDHGSIVLDAREEHAFARGHIAGAGRMTRSEFRERRVELPPRTSSVLVVHDDPEEARRAAEALAALEYPRVAWLDAPLAALPGGRASREPAAPLWSPSPFLASVLPLLSPGRALDVAAGAGRESVHLARHGWSVEAWDHDPGALARAEALALRCGVTIVTRRVDIERVQDLPRGGHWDTIVVCRYLHRALFPWLEAALAPGGTLVYETFRRGQERHGRPRQSRHLLESGELERAFPSLELVRHEQTEPPDGPVMAHLLARRAAADVAPRSH